MNETTHLYAPPKITQDSEYIPVEVRDYLNGEKLLSKKQAIRLSTVNRDGWPHASLLSAGDMILLPTNLIRFLMFESSGTVSNLKHDSRLVLIMSVLGKMCEIRTYANHYKTETIEVPLAFFEAQIKEVRMHVAPYAEIVSGVNFELHDPDQVNKRWQKQIAALKKDE